MPPRKKGPKKPASASSASTSSSTSAATAADAAAARPPFLAQALPAELFSKAYAFLPYPEQLSLSVVSKGLRQAVLDSLPRAVYCVTASSSLSGLPRLLPALRELVLFVRTDKEYARLHRRKVRHARRAHLSPEQWMNEDLDADENEEEEEEDEQEDDLLYGQEGNKFELSEDTVDRLSAEEKGRHPWLDMTVLVKMPRLKKLTLILECPFRMLSPPSKDRANPEQYRPCSLKSLVSLEVRMDRSVRVRYPMMIELTEYFFWTLRLPVLKELELEGVHAHSWTGGLGKALQRSMGTEGHPSSLESVSMRGGVIELTNLMGNDGPGLKKLSFTLHDNVDYGHAIQTAIEVAGRLLTLPVLQFTVIGNRAMKRRPQNLEYWTKTQDSGGPITPIQWKQMALLFEAFGSGENAVVSNAVVDLLSDPARTLPTTAILDGLETLLRECPLQGLTGILERVSIIAEVVLAQLQKDAAARDPSRMLGRIASLVSTRRRYWWSGRPSFALTFATTLVERGLLGVLLSILAQGEDKDGKPTATPVMFLLRALPYDAFCQVAANGSGRASEDVTLPLLLRLVDTVTLRHARRDARRLWNLALLQQVLLMLPPDALVRPVVQARERVLSLVILQCMGEGFLRTWFTSSQRGRMPHPGALLLRNLSNMDTAFLPRLRDCILEDKLVVASGEACNTGRIPKGLLLARLLVACCLIGIPFHAIFGRGVASKGPMARVMEALVEEVRKEQAKAAVSPDAPVITPARIELSLAVRKIRQAEGPAAVVLSSAISSDDNLALLLVLPVREDDPSEVFELLQRMFVNDDKRLVGAMLQLGRSSPQHQEVVARALTQFLGNLPRASQVRLLSALHAPGFAAGRDLVLDVMLGFAERAASQVMKVHGIVKALQKVHRFDARILYPPGEKTGAAVSSFFLEDAFTKAVIRLAVKVCDGMEKEYEGCMREGVVDFLLAVLSDCKRPRKDVLEVVTGLATSHPQGVQYVHKQVCRAYRHGDIEGGHLLGGEEEEDEEGANSDTSSYGVPDWAAHYGGDYSSDSEEEEEEEDWGEGSGEEGSGDEELMAPMVAAAVAFQAEAQAHQDFVEIVEMEEGSDEESDEEEEEGEDGHAPGGGDAGAGAGGAQEDEEEDSEEEDEFDEGFSDASSDANSLDFEDEDSSGDEYDEEPGGGEEEQWYMRGHAGPDGVVMDCEAPLEEAMLWV